MAKIYDKDLDKDSKIDWGGDARPEEQGGTGGLPVSGRVVQKFIKDNLDDLKDSVNGIPADPEHQIPATPGLKDRMDDAEDAIGDLEETVNGDGEPGTGLANRMDNAESAIDDLNDDIDAINDDIDGVRDDISDLEDTVNGTGEPGTGLTERMSTVEDDINNNSTGLKKRMDDVEDDINNNSTGLKKRMTDVEETIEQIDPDAIMEAVEEAKAAAEAAEEAAEQFDPEALNQRFDGKAGYFYNDSDTNQVLVFKDEATALTWAAQDPRDYNDPSILGKFSAPSDFEAIVHILGLDGATTKYIQYGTKGQRVRATFEIIRRSSSQPEPEAVIATVIIKDEQGITLFEKSQNVAAGGTIDMDVDDYLINGRNFITVRIRGAETGTVGSASYSIVALSLILTDNFNISQIVTDGSLIVPWNVEGTGVKYMDWYIDGSAVSLNNSIGSNPITSGSKQIIVNNLAPGKHTLQYYVYQEIGIGDKFYSDVLYRDFIIDTADSASSQLPSNYIAILSAFTAPANVSSTPVIIEGTGTQADPVIMGGVTQYEPSEISYGVYYKDQSANKQFTITFDGKSSVYTVSSGLNRVYEYSMRSYNAGVRPMTFECGTEEVYFNVSVAASDFEIDQITDGLKFNFSGSDESNTSATRDSWHYSNGTQTFTGTLTGFNWNANSGWNNGRLVIPEGASFVTNYVPFDQNIDIKQNGFTFEIEFQTNRVLNERTAILDLRDSNDRGLLITTSEVIYTSGMNKLVSTKYKPEENIRVDIVINPAEGASEYKSLLMIYIDGILSGVEKYDSDDYFYTDANFSITGTADATVQLKQVRCYIGALSPNDVLNNYMLYRDTAEELLEVYKRNDIYVNPQEKTSISADKLADETPIIIITGKDPDDPVTQQHPDPLSVLLGFGTDNKGTYVRMYRLQVINKKDPSRNMILQDLGMRCQGTSSMMYPIKNFRFYTQAEYNSNPDKDKSDKTYNPKPGAVGGVYYTRMWVGGENPIEDGTELIGSNRLYSFNTKAQPVKCWCLKADYAESSSTHNTGVARLWNEALSNLTVKYSDIDNRYYLKPAQGGSNDPVKVCQTIAQKKAAENDYPYDVRTTVDGFPITVFYHTHDNEQLRFVGRYNWNNDKSTESVFGFKGIPGFDIDPETGEPYPSGQGYGKTMECWEVTEGDMPVNTFVNLDHWNEDPHGWKESFEARYPDDHKEETEKYRARKESTDPETGVFDPGGALWQVCKWINSTMGASHVVVDQSGHAHMEENDPILYAKFQNEKWQHLDVYKMAAYYCYLMRFGAVDQVVKNAMFTTEDGYHWYYINYDNDTINGVDNSGKLRFGYDIDRQTPDPDSASGYCYAGHDSVLWNNLEADTEFMAIVKIVDNALYDTNILTYSTTIDMFNNKQSAAWSERTHNEDYKYKYIGYPDHYSKLQGPRKSHRQWWLSNRFARMDAINGVGSYKNNLITIKPVNNQPVRVGDSVTITSAAEGQIFGYSFGNAMKESDRTAPIGDSIIFNFSPSDTYNVGAELKFYNPVFMGKFDMSRISDIAGEIKFNSVNSDSFDSTLTEIILGDENSNDNTYSRLVLSGLDQVKYLEKFVMRHYTGVSSIDLSSNEYLKYVDLRDCTNLVNISLPAAAPINTLYYPGNIENINLTDLAYLNNFGLDSYASVKSITIHGCPNLTGNDGKSVVFNWLANKTTPDSNCSLDLDNINWTNVTDAQIQRIITFYDNGGTLTFLGKIQLQNTITDLDLALKLESMFGGSNVWNSSSAFYIDVDPSLIIVGPDEILEGDSYTYTTYYIGYEGYAPTDWQQWIFDTPLADRRPGTGLDENTGELTTTENGSPNGTVIFRCNKFSPGLGPHGTTINGIKTVVIKRRVYPTNDLSNVNISGNNNVIVGTNGFTLDLASTITGAMTATWEVTGRLANWVTLTPQGDDNMTGCVVNMSTAPHGEPAEDYLVVPGTLQVTLRYKNGTTGHPAGSIVGDQGIKAITIGYKDSSIALSTATNPAAMSAMQRIPAYAEKTYLTIQEVGSINESALQPGSVAANSVFYSSVFRTQCKTFNEFELFTGLTYIPTYLFYSCVGLEEITLPPNITAINSYAFAGCSKLKRIVIPKKVTTIDQNAFANCSALEEVIFEDGGPVIANINQYAFYNCAKLSSFTIPENETLTTIKDYTFLNCSKLTNIVIPNNIVSIGRSAFNGCSSLVSVTFGTGMRSIGYETFSNCTKLVSIDVVDNITSIDYASFSNCSSLISARIGNGVASLGTSVFSNCVNLETLSIGDNVTTVPSGFCYNCTKLKSLHIGKKVGSFQQSNYSMGYTNGYLTGFGAKYSIPISSTGYSYSFTQQYANNYISSWSFAGCVNLETITVDSDNTTYYDGTSGGGLNCLLYKRNNANVLIAACKTSIIPHDCKAIGGGAFTNISVVDVNIPASVTSIYTGAFADCSTLETVTIAQNSALTSIQSAAFANCKKLREFVVPELVTYIADYAFADNLQLSTFTTNNAITSIGQYAFTGDIGLSSFVVPRTVTSIGQYAFQKCENIETFTIPTDSRLTAIQHYTFYSCKRLTSLYVPDSVTNIQSCACRGCTSLHQLHIGKGVTSIASDAFRSFSITECLDLNGITVDVENEIFSDSSILDDPIRSYNCIINKSNHSIILGCKNTRWSPIAQSIGPYAFAYVPGVTEVVIPDGLGISTIDNYAFYGCRTITHVKLGNLVNTIGDCAFQDCTSLYKVDLSLATTSIGGSAFYNCTILRDVAVRADQPPLLPGGSNTFGNTSLVSIYVNNEETANAYIGASQWSSYQNKIRYPIPNDF